MLCGGGGTAGAACDCTVSGAAFGGRSAPPFGAAAGGGGALGCGATGSGTAGGGAGIAAAFNTPIAGAVFAFEEIGRSFEKENAGTIVRTVLVACIACMSLFGDYLFYGNIDIRLHGAGEWVFVPLLGIFFGMLGGLFAQSLLMASPAGRRPSLGGRRKLSALRP